MQGRAAPPYAAAPGGIPGRWAAATPPPAAPGPAPWARGLRPWAPPPRGRSCPYTPPQPLPRSPQPRRRDYLRLCGSCLAVGPAGYELTPAGRSANGSPSPLGPRRSLVPGQSRLSDLTHPLALKNRLGALHPALAVPCVGAGRGEPVPQAAAPCMTLGESLLRSAGLPRSRGE